MSFNQHPYPAGARVPEGGVAGSSIPTLLSSARQPLTVAPASGTTIREPTLLRKLQAAKEAARLPAKTNQVGNELNAS
jgi:hypothetical protein